MPSTPFPPEAFDLARAVLRARFGHPDFRPGQEPVIRSLLRGGRALAVMPTGSGKSLCFQLPALLSEGLTLVISPLISLMKDQVEELERQRIPAAFINSSLPPAEQAARIEKARRGEYRLLYVAPERLRSPRFLHLMDRLRLALVAVDEAHCVSEWGHDFRPDYLKIRGFIESARPGAVAALTATATPRAQRDILEQLGIPEAEIFVTGFDRPNLAFAARRFLREKDKDRALCRFVQGREGSGIIYVGTRRGAESVADLLRSFRIGAEAYHAGLDESARASVQDRFMAGKTRILVATNAFGMGIDKRDVRFVFHYNMPASPEAYYQEAGRAGRDGAPAECFLCSSPSDVRLQEFFIEESCPVREKIEAVYDVLRKAKSNPVAWGDDQIAKAAEVRMTGMGVSSCVRILAEAGAVQRLEARDNPGLASFLLEPDVAEKDAGGAPSRSVAIRVLSELCEGVRDRRVEFQLDWLARRMGMDAALAQRILSDLSHEGVIEYYPPLTGRGVRLLTASPFGSLPIPWDGLQRRRRSDMEKLDSMLAYVSHAGCRRRWIVSYFGDATGQGGDCSCDRCQGETETMAPTAYDSVPQREGYAPKEAQAALTLLRCVGEMPWNVGLNKIAQIVCGSKSEWIVAADLTRLGTFGAFRGSQDAALRTGQKLLRDGFLTQGKGRFPTIALSPRGCAALENEEALPSAESGPAWTERIAAAASIGDAAISRLPSQASGDDDEPFGIAPEIDDGVAFDPVESRADRSPDDGRRGKVGDEALFQRLRDLRAELAKRRRTKPFKVLPDATLKEMARQRPQTLGELLGIKGIGPVKAQKFGETFLSEIASFPRAGQPARKPVARVIEIESVSPGHPAPDAHIARMGGDADAPLPDPLAILECLLDSWLQHDLQRSTEAWRRLEAFDRSVMLEAIMRRGSAAPGDEAALRLIEGAARLQLPEGILWLHELTQTGSPKIQRAAADAIAALRENPGRRPSGLERRASSPTGMKASGAGASSTNPPASQNDFFSIP